jgi:Rrf2 family protein
MEITREADYAVRCVLYLSSGGGSLTMMDEIAAEMRIPRAFLAKILQKLTKAGITKSIRGPRGGVQMVKDPSTITLLDVVEAIDGPLTMNRCGIDKHSCIHSPTCTVHPFWLRLREIVADYLQSVDFARLRDQGRLTCAVPSHKTNHTLSRIPVKGGNR